jgi:hypothetical protein
VKLLLAIYVAGRAIGGEGILPGVGVGVGVGVNVAVAVAVAVAVGVGVGLEDARVLKVLSPP